MAFRRCEALYDYDAKDSEELTIRKGDILTINLSDGAWWEVTNDRRMTGLVPCNYVKELPEEQQVNASSSFRMQPVEQPGMYQQTDLVKTGSLNIRAIAKFNYVAKRDDELGLEKGCELIVIEKEQDGWWRGRCGSRIGWFPFNYVDEIATVTVTEKCVICTVMALYSFNSGNPEELVFNKGDVLDIIDQPQDDPDWWEAKLADGRTGLIPRNYVEVMGGASGGKPKSPPVGGPQGGWSGPTGGSSVQQSSPLMPHVGSNPPPFSQEPWYYGRLSRKDAEKNLNFGGQDGQFLVRESETKVEYTHIIHLSLSSLFPLLSLSSLLSPSLSSPLLSPLPLSSPSLLSPSLSSPSLLSPSLSSLSPLLSPFLSLSPLSTHLSVICLFTIY